MIEGQASTSWRHFPGVVQYFQYFSVFLAMVKKLKKKKKSWKTVAQHCHLCQPIPQCQRVVFREAVILSTGVINRYCLETHFASEVLCLLP